MQNKVRKTCIINVSGVSEHPYVLDLSEVVENEVVIDIHDDSDAKILLNYHENTNKTVVFNLGKNSNVVLNILSLKHSVNCNYRFELDTQANILVAFADFATGVSSLNAVFNLNGEYSEAKWHLACLSKNKDKKSFFS